MKPDQVCLQLANRDSSSYDAFPSVQFLSRVSLTLPLDNCWPERGFSQMKRIKTPQGNKIGPNMLQYLMNIKMNGWVVLSKQRALEIAKRWFSEKGRRISRNKDQKLKRSLNLATEEDGAYLENIQKFYQTKIEELQDNFEELLK
ncbi:MAG: hypothetical protein EZS28_003087 [Streblomastix strix]|uniref:HAT C-terminal dimerisation domain-containing protein n=1 Tax=Streblomastix strix TaxID=222440 RepID=A0A5J4X4E5_9EUKA|nr:MAG: hypothetical protein EZS28_003087 [Streblomastix strix]